MNASAPPSGPSFHCAVKATLKGSSHSRANDSLFSYLLDYSAATLYHKHGVKTVVALRAKAQFHLYVSAFV